MENQTNKPVKSYAARRRTRKVVALSCLALFMALTIGLTWTLWQSGILGDTAVEDNITIQIGRGQRIVTELDLDAFNRDDRVLIPQAVVGAADAQAGAVGYLEKTVDVTWVSNPVVSGLTSVGMLVITPGDLVAPARSGTDNLVEVTLENGTESAWRYRDLQHVNPVQRYTGDARLFDFDFIAGAITVNLTEMLLGAAQLENGEAVTHGLPITIDDDTPLEVTIRITMNIPRAQNLLTAAEIYQAVAGNLIEFDLNFEVGDTPFVVTA